MNEQCYTCEHKGKCYRQATFYGYEDCDHYSKSINTDVEGCLSIIMLENHGENGNCYH